MTLDYRTGFVRLRSLLHDRVTDLPAYAVLFDELRALLDRRRHIGVLHVEAVNLAMVESLYGWQVFDRIVERIAATLRDGMGDELPAGTRLAINGTSGDRFVAFLPEGPDGEVDGEYLARTASAVTARLGEAFAGDDFASLSPRLVFVAGHALLSENPFYRFERRVHTAIEEARALQGKKEKRRDRLFGSELRRIIRDSDVAMCFQPVVDLETRKVFGYEALARGPKDSMFEMPATMFALSGQVGASIELDRMCRKKALLESAPLRGKGKLFLNVVPGCLGDAAWLEREVGELEECGPFEPGEIVFELSERGIPGDGSEIAGALEDLKRSGIGLAVDDLGTGYSSLATLEEVQPDYIKIDPTLVRDIDRTLIKQDLLASLIHIGGRIGASVIAEGVETEEEVTFLRGAGTRYGQGFVFAQPSRITP